MRILFGRKENKNNDFIQQFQSCCLCMVRKLSDFIKTILIFVLKMNEALTGLDDMSLTIPLRPTLHYSSKVVFF